MKRLEDRIFEALRNEGVPVASDELARRFLGVPAAGRTAARIIDGALGRDRRFHPVPGGWAAVHAPSVAQSLNECPWRVLLGDAPGGSAAGVRVVVVAEFQPGEEDSFAAAGYVTGPAEAVGAVTAQFESAAVDLSLQPVSEMKLLRFLDEQFSRPGLFVRGFNSRALGSTLAAAEDTGTGLPEHFHDLADLLRLANPGGQPMSPEAVYDRYQVPVRREEPLLAELSALPAILPRLIEELALAGIERLDEIPPRLEEIHRPLDLARYEFGRSELDAVPEAPGVYAFLDAGGHALYVGKSVNLRRRVNSYFRWQADGDPKLERIQLETRRLAYEPMGSDFEALLEEATRIARLRPPINVQLEIHETPQEKGIQDPLLAVFPHRDEGRAVLFLLHPSGRIQRLGVEREADPSLLDRFLAAAAEKDEPFPTAEIYGAEVSPLALRWLRKNSHRLTFFRYHDFPGRGDVVRAVGGALAQGQFAERNIFL